MPVIAAPPVVAIAQRFRRVEQGIVTFLYHRTLDAHAGPSSRHEDFLFEGIYENGKLMRVRMLKYTIGKSSASADQIAGVVTSYEHPKPGDLFAAPWDPRYLSQYRERADAANTIAFTALNTSRGYGNGTFSYSAQRDVTAYQYVPTVMPPYTSSGTIAGARAQVLPGYWAMTQERQVYRGHVGIFSGGATVQITQSNFRRFSTLRAALAALATSAR